MTATKRRTVGRIALAIGLVLAAGCAYAALPLPTASGVEEGAFPDRVDRLLGEAGGRRPIERLLPATARDSGAIYLLAVNQRAQGLGDAEVAVLPRADAGRKYPSEGWRLVDAFGVYSQRLVPGEYVVYVRASHAWSTRKIVKLKAGAVDTLLAVMRSGLQPGAGQ